MTAWQADIVQMPDQARAFNVSPWTDVYAKCQKKADAARRCLNHQQVFGAAGASRLAPTSRTGRDGSCIRMVRQMTYALSPH